MHYTIRIIVIALLLGLVSYIIWFSSPFSASVTENSSLILRGSSLAECESLAADHPGEAVECDYQSGTLIHVLSSQTGSAPKIILSGSVLKK